jgi:hypothetical protein
MDRKETAGPLRFVHGTPGSRDDKAEVGDFIRGLQIGWPERNSRSLHYAALRFHGRPDDKFVGVSTKNT